jgi:hypothetical protein
MLCVYFLPCLVTYCLFVYETCIQYVMNISADILLISVLKHVTICLHAVTSVLNTGSRKKILGAGSQLP